MISNMIHELLKLLYVLLSLPKSIVFNFYYLPWRQAIKIPVLIAPRLRLRYMGGEVRVDGKSFATVQIGFHSFGRVAGGGAWNVKGSVHFQGKARIGCDPTIQVDGCWTVGKNFEAGRNFLILCHKEVKMGHGVLLSWNVEVMDTDSHNILNEKYSIINAPKPVNIGDNCWLGSHVCVLKGASLATGCIVASHALVTKPNDTPNTLLMGMPALPVRSNMYWKP